MPKPTVLIGASAVAVTSSSATLLIARPDNDLIRSTSTIGLVCSAIAATYLLVDRRLSRMETMTARMVRTERDVLTAIREQDRGIHHLN